VYNGETFDHDAFYAWAEQQTAPLIISEYTMPEDSFVRIASIGKRQTLSGGSGAFKSEGLWMPKAQAEKIPVFDLFPDIA
jgi:hypothetical protein